MTPKFVFQIYGTNTKHHYLLVFVLAVVLVARVLVVFFFRLGHEFL